MIRPGDVQRMSAGTGVVHSEFNASRTDPVHFLQIWIQPQEHGIAPGYEQKTVLVPGETGKLRLIASADGRDGSVTIHQDASVFAAVLGEGDRIAYEPKASRHVWVHVARGEARLNGEELSAGDGAAASGERALTLQAADGAEILLFDLP